LPLTNVQAYIKIYQNEILVFNISRWTDFCLSILRAIDFKWSDKTLIKATCSNYNPKEGSENVYCRNLETAKKK
jgi:hypothetical protein